MSLEEKIAALTAAVEANTAALKAGGGAKAGTGSSSPASKHTRAEMQAAMNELKEKKGAPEAKALIKEVGGVDKLADIPDDKIDACFDAAKKKLAAEDI